MQRARNKSKIEIRNQQAEKGVTIVSNLVAQSSLQELASKIDSAFEQSKELYDKGVNSLKAALLCDKEAGEYLIQVKGSLPHGSFISWIEDNCKFGERHARNLMAIAKNWQQIVGAWDSKTAARCRFDEDPLPSLRQALSMIAAPKEKAEKAVEQASRPTQYKVASKGDCYGETVEVIEELHGGDVVKCRTSKGEFPFLKNELASVDAELVVDAEIVEEETEDKSEELREAIALIIEYLPQEALITLLAQSLYIGKEHLPEEIYQSKVKLAGVNSVEVCK
jgi:hypothetical protein